MELLLLPILTARYLISRIITNNNSQLLMKIERKITLKRGKTWNPSSQKEKSAQSVSPSIPPMLTYRCIELECISIETALDDCEDPSRSQPNWDSSVFQSLVEQCWWDRGLTQPELHQFCKEHNILLMAYSPLGGQHPGGHKVHGSASPLEDETVPLVPFKLSKFHPPWLKHYLTLSDWKLFNSF